MASLALLRSPLQPESPLPPSRTHGWVLHSMSLWKGSQHLREQ